MAKSHIVLLAGLSLAIFFAVTAIAAPGPLLVDIAAAFSSSVPAVGQIVTAAAATWAVVAILIGPVSDAYGRKPVLVLGLCLLGAGAAGVGLSESLLGAMAFGCVIGVGGGMVPPTCIALAGDTLPDEFRPMSIAGLTMATGASSVVGVPAAAVLGDVAGWRTSFLTIGAALFLTALLLFFLLPHRKPARTRLRLLGRLTWTIAFPVTWHIAATNLTGRVAWGAIVTFFPAYLIVTYDMETAATALPVAFVALWSMAAPLLGGRVGRARRRLQITSALLIAAAAPGFGVFLAEWGAWQSAIMAGVLMLLIIPVTTVLSIVCAETGGAHRGALAGVISSTNWAGTAAGAGIGGMLATHAGFNALSALLVAAILTSSLLMALLAKNQAVARARARFAISPD